MKMKESSILSIVAAVIFALAVTVSCGKIDDVLDSIPTDSPTETQTSGVIKLNITVADPEGESSEDEGPVTKATALKSTWAKGDILKIWYDGNTGTNPDLVVEFDGSKWATKTSGVTLSGKNPKEGGGTLSAVYDGTIKLASNKRSYTYAYSSLGVTLDEWKYLTEVQINVYTNGSTTIDRSKSYTLACNHLKPCTGITVGSNGISAKTGTTGDAVTGIANANVNGVSFVFACADATSTQDYTFTIKQGSEEKVYTAESKSINTDKTLLRSIRIAADKFTLADRINGLFSVSATKKVYFSKGNLYYNGSSFEFETHQYDYETDVSSTHLSYFHYSDDASKAMNYQEMVSPGTEETVFFTNDPNARFEPNPNFTANGQTGKWRVLAETSDHDDDNEWWYILTKRNVPYVFAYATVCGVGGLILFPDSYSHPSGVTAIQNLNESPRAYDQYNNYDATQWAKIEAAGAVFLPAAGYWLCNKRLNGSGYVYGIRDEQIDGEYIIVDPYGGSLCCSAYFSTDTASEGIHYQYSYRCISVRLVTDAN